MKEADDLLTRAWALSSAVNNRELVEVAETIAVLRLRQKQYNEAQWWLNQSQDLLKKVELEAKEYLRLLVPNPYYRAKILYRSQEFDKVKALYHEVLELARSIGWQRVVLYSQNGLADVSIMTNDLDKAEQLLQTGLPVVERNKDKRCLALYKRSFAYLEQKRGNLDKAQSWAEQALDGFERLGMYPEMKKMRALIATIQRDTSPATHLTTSL